MKATDFNKIFDSVVEIYHQFDDVNKKCPNPYKPGSMEFLLFQKCWIDAVQWHLEDIIRDPAIDPAKALDIKRWIDRSNQERTDTVEYIDSFLLDHFKDVKPLEGARVNTETPAWSIDRLSILALKIFHMREQASRPDASPEHLQKCSDKLNVLLMQREDLTKSIDELLEDFASGKKIMKVYKQMKMYNDPSMNPVLYGKK
ncbi:MAG: DUF4254 domain-containing protein [Bacteroidales bacterium]